MRWASRPDEKKVKKTVDWLKRLVLESELRMEMDGSHNTTQQEEGGSMPTESIEKIRVRVQVTKSKSVTLEQGVPMAHEYVDETGCKWSIRSGKVKLADGTEHDAVIQLCDQDSGEHWGTGVWVAGCPRGIVWQDDHDFLTVLGKTTKQVFPYRYKYHGVIANDHHVSADGWSY